MIGLGLDEDPAATKEFATANGLKWPQGHLPPSSLTADYAVKSLPKIVLIGPDGKVAATDLSGDRIRQAVAKALAQPQEPVRAR